MTALRIPRQENIVLTGPEDPIDYYSMPVVGRLYLRRLRMILDPITELGPLAAKPGTHRRWVEGSGKVLDVGYASGILFPELAGRFDKLFGIDVHLKGHDVKKAMEREGVAVELCSGNIFALPYKDESFDCVIVVSVLEHIEDLDRALREVSRVLDKDGVAVFGFPNSTIVMKAAFRLIGFREVGERHISSLTRILSALGREFVIEKRKALPGFLPLRGSLYVVCMCRKAHPKAAEKAHGALIAGRAHSFWGYDTPMGRERIKRRSMAILRLAGVKPGMRLLELGSGTGMYSEEFSGSGARIAAIDLSLDMLRRARSSVRKRGVDFLVADAEILPFKDGSFDAVAGNAVLHHVDLGRSLAEIMRVLGPEGAFAFAEPNMLNPQVFIQKNIPWMKRHMGDSPEETAFVRWKVRSFLRESGVRDARAVPYDFMHPRFPGGAGWVSFFRGLSSAMEGIPFVKELAGSILISGRKSEGGER